MSVIVGVHTDICAFQTYTMYSLLLHIHVDLLLVNNELHVSLTPGSLTSDNCTHIRHKSYMSYCGNSL